MNFLFQFQISNSNPKSGKLSGQSTLSEDDSGTEKASNIDPQISNTSDESAATLAANDSLSRQSSSQRRDNKFSKSRNPIQCLNPTELQVHALQCGNFMIFLSLRFYVNSILGILEVQNQPF